MIQTKHISRTGVDNGFALLLTLVVISVVLAIGLSLLDITVKQLTLSAAARDSEVAFYAANAGAECGQETRQAIDISSGVPSSAITYYCFGQTFNSSPIGAYPLGGVNRSKRFYSQFTWDIAGTNVCTQVDTIMMDARIAGYTHVFTGQGLASKECETGNICTIIFTRGYNRACNDLGSLRVVQRELTIDF